MPGIYYLEESNSDVKGESDQVSTEIEVRPRKVFEVRKRIFLKQIQLCAGLGHQSVDRQSGSRDRKLEHVRGAVWWDRKSVS